MKKYFSVNFSCWSQWYQFYNEIRTFLLCIQKRNRFVVWRQFLPPYQNLTCEIFGSKFWSLNFNLKFYRLIVYHMVIRFMKFDLIFNARMYTTSLLKLSYCNGKRLILSIWFVARYPRFYYHFESEISSQFLGMMLGIFRATMLFLAQHWDILELGYSWTSPGSKNQRRLMMELQPFILFKVLVSFSFDPQRISISIYILTNEIISLVYPFSFSDLSS